MLRDSRVRAVVWVLIGVMAATVIALVLVAASLTAQIRQTQLEGTPTGKKLVAASDRILDCTDPAGGRDSCYQRNQRRTAEAVGQIGAANILTVVCALNVPNGTPLQEALDQVTQCVADRLSRQH
jgi:hypothetical protein